MTQITTNFDSGTYTATNKPVAATLKADIANIKAGHNAHESDTSPHGLSGTIVGTTDNQTLTNKTLTSPVINTGVSGTAIVDEDTMTSDSATKVPTQQSVKAYVDTHIADTTTHGVTGVVVGISDTQTLTNKRVTRRTDSTTSSATPTINTDNVDMYLLTAQAEAITSFTTNLSGTPTEGQTLWIAITGTAAWAITWGNKFEASTVALPTTTVTTNGLDVGFVWNTVTSMWRCIAVS